MHVTLEFVLDEGSAPISGFDVNGVGALAAIPLPGDSVCLSEDGPTYVVESRAFNWHSPPQLRVEIFLGFGGEKNVAGS